MQAATLPQAVSLHAADPAAEDRLYRKVTARIIPLFFLGFVFSYLDRVNISLAKLPMTRDFGLSDHAFAIGASIFFWGYMLFEVPSNLLLQRVGARAWIARIMITWGLVSTLMVFSRSQAVFYSLRLLLGICEAGFVPGVMYYANLWFPSRRQSGMFSLFLLALPTAEVIGGPLSGLIIEHMGGVAGLHGWQWLFILEGSPTVVLGVVIFVLLRNGPADAEWLSAEEKRVITANLAVEDRGKSHRLLDVFMTPQVYLLIAIMILFNTGFYGLVFWLPTIIQNAGVVGSGRVGLLTAVPFAVGGVAMLVVARLAERIGHHRLIAALCAAVAALGMFAAKMLEGQLPLALTALSLSIAGVLSLMPIFWSLPGRLLSGSAAAGGLALINSCGSLSGLLGVLIIGYAGTQLGMSVLAGMFLLSGVLLYLAHPPNQITSPPLQALAAE